MTDASPTMVVIVSVVMALGVGLILAAIYVLIARLLLRRDRDEPVSRIPPKRPRRDRIDR